MGLRMNTKAHVTTQHKIQLDSLGIGSVVGPNLALTKSNFVFDMVAEENTTIYQLKIDFIENLARGNILLKTKMDEVKKRNFIHDEFRAAPVNIGPVLDFSKSYKYQKENKMKRRNWNTLNQVKDLVVQKIMRNREKA